MRPVTVAAASPEVFERLGGWSGRGEQIKQVRALRKAASWRAPAQDATLVLIEGHAAHMFSIAKRLRTRSSNASAARCHCFKTFALLAGFDIGEVLTHAQSQMWSLGLEKDERVRDA